MADIYIETDNGATGKLFIATLAGKSAATVEKLMRDTIRKIAEKKGSGFTLKKDQGGIGYAIGLSVAKIDKAALFLKCDLSGYIERYPPKLNFEGKPGQELVGLKLTGNGKVNGTTDADMLFCIESVVEKMMEKSCIPAMRQDMANRPAPPPP